MKAMNVPSDGVDHSHGVEMSEGSLSSTKTTCQQLDDALDVGGISKLDHIEAAVGKEDLQRGLVSCVG